MIKDFFDGFKWNLPKAFADALAKCLFEVGDVIYDNPKAYSINWSNAKFILKHSIQVKSISSSNTTQNESNYESVFFDNWNSEITIDFFSYPLMEKIELTTTQGRLYSFLWKGDEEYILTKNKFIEKSLLLKSVSKNIMKYTPELLKSTNSDYDYLFIFSVNIANQFYNEKLQKIKSSFNNKSEFISYRVQTYSPSDIGNNSLLNICPTIRFNVFEINGTFDIINESLKNALYVPSKNKKSDKEYFRLKAHGVLLAQ